MRETAVQVMRRRAKELDVTINLKRHTISYTRNGHLYIITQAARTAREAVLWLDGMWAERRANLEHGGVLNENF